MVSPPGLDESVTALNINTVKHDMAPPPRPAVSNLSSTENDKKPGTRVLPGETLKVGGVRQIRKARKVRPATTSALAATENTMEPVVRTDPVDTKAEAKLDLFKDGDQVHIKFEWLPRCEGRGVKVEGGEVREHVTPEFMRIVLDALGEAFSYYNLPGEKFGAKERSIICRVTLLVLTECRRLRKSPKLFADATHRELFMDASESMYEMLIELYNLFPTTPGYAPPQLPLTPRWVEYFARMGDGPAIKVPEIAQPYVQTLPRGAVAIANHWKEKYENTAQALAKPRPNDSAKTSKWRENLLKAFYEQPSMAEDGDKRRALQETLCLETQYLDTAEPTKRGPSESSGSLSHLSRLADKFNPAFGGGDIEEEDEEGEALDIITFPKKAVEGDDDLGGMALSKSE